jgi:hypothetical protein
MRYGKMAIMKIQQYETAFRAKVSLERSKGEKAVAKIAEVHPNLWTI